VVRKSDNLRKLSDLFDIPQKRLSKINDLQFAGPFQSGQVIYLESKRRKATVKTHTVEKGETLYEISQRYGIKLKLLCKLTGMTPGIIPYPGQVLSLR
jgi:LysM repeat protein